MPRGDGTGPEGMGPMTGRAAGYCAGYGQPGYMAPGPGRGWRAGVGPGGGYGRGFRPGVGRGLGFRHGYGRGHGPGWFQAGYGPWTDVPDRQTETEYLRSEAESLERHLEAIRGRLDEIERDSAEEE